jgi:hypothetical protein
MKGREHLEDVDADGMTLEWNLGKYGGSGYEPVVDPCGRGNELSGTIK